MSTPVVPEPSQWTQIVEADPEHSRRYRQRFINMANEGADLGGEARLIDALAPRNARVLDAGCGPGRVGGRIAQAGHTVVGVDGDAYLIEAARTDWPDVTWIHEDLSVLDLSLHGITEGFDMIVCPGNVMTFLAPNTRVTVLSRLRAHLNLGGRAVIGFGADRGYDFNDFITDAHKAGLVPQHLFATWDLERFSLESDFLVAVLKHA